MGKFERLEGEEVKVGVVVVNPESVDEVMCGITGSGLGKPWSAANNDSFNAMVTVFSKFGFLIHN
jgi:hypothetical protein